MREATGPRDALVPVGRVAGRIRRFAEAIAQGHEFGLGPGEQSEPWSLDFQRIAVPLYATVLPWPYLLSLAEGFEDCANRMAAVRPNNDFHQWERIECYLRAANKAIVEGAPGRVEHEFTTADQVTPDTPPVMPFNLLAELLSASAVEALQQAGAAVEQACGSVDTSPLTDQEAHWIRLIVDGERTIDIAEASGYSERALYRALHELWSRLGVDNRNEAIALTTKNGWL